MNDDKFERMMELERFVRFAAGALNVDLDLLKSHRRTNELAETRQVAMATAATILDATLCEVGDAFGGRDHGTVIHAKKKVMRDDLLSRCRVLRLAWLGNLDMGHEIYGN